MTDRTHRLMSRDLCLYGAIRKAMPIHLHFALQGNYRTLHHMQLIGFSQLCCAQRIPSLAPAGKPVALEVLPSETTQRGGRHVGTPAHFQSAADSLAVEPALCLPTEGHETGSVSTRAGRTRAAQADCGLSLQSRAQLSDPLLSMRSLDRCRRCGASSNCPKQSQMQFATC